MITDYQEEILEDGELPPEGEALSAKTLRIRELNDAMRTADTIIDALLANGQLVITRGVAARCNDFINRAVEAVRRFDKCGPGERPVRRARLRHLRARR
jgi:hypothetical protein